MQILKEYISQILKEATKLPDDFYRPLENAIAASQFWTFANGPDDADFNSVGGEDVDQTEAAEVLGYALLDFFKSVNYPLIPLVRSPDVEYGDNRKFLVGKDHRYYPNKIVAGGQMGLTNTGRRILYLDLMVYDEDFDIDDVSSSSVVSDVASVVRHELIHASQYDKRAKKQKISRSKAKKAFEDDGSIVVSNDRQEYLSSHIEIDAYAHEFAEQLLQDYGLERALELIRTSNKAEDLPVSDQLEEYLDGISSQKAFRNLMGKVYTQIMDLKDRKIY